MPDSRFPVFRHLGRQDYADTYAAMRAFTHARSADTPDEIWLLEHPPVFTQGQAGKPEHLLMPGDIPVVQSDRGGQVTYHGPGQLVGYVLLDLQRLGYGIRSLVTRLEDALIATLAGYDIPAQSNREAPGVYVNGEKIASLGLRVRNGRTYHGLALNVDMDLEPFSRINPCGYQGLKMTQVKTLGGPGDLSRVGDDLQKNLLQHLGYPR
ncbi:MAG: lipoyl(octanoyl) transferase LipB [Stenotrophobium sp.]